jgi:urease accessory protein UreF
MKHVEDAINHGRIQDGATVPVWLANDGLISVDTALTYAETAELLKEIAKWAEVFSDAREAREKLSKLSPGGWPRQPS